MFKVNNRNSRTKSEISSKLTITEHPVAASVKQTIPNTDDINNTLTRTFTATPMEG